RGGRGWSARTRPRGRAGPLSRRARGALRTRPARRARQRPRARRTMRAGRRTGLCNCESFELSPFGPLHRAVSDIPEPGQASGVTEGAGRASAAGGRRSGAKGTAAVFLLAAFGDSVLITRWKARRIGPEA